MSTKNIFQGNFTNLLILPTKYGFIANKP